MWPIAKVVTSDGYTLHGLYSPLEDAECVLIHVHGTGGAFFWNDFYSNIVEVAYQHGLASLLTNNRGSGVYELETGRPFGGVSLELFEDCLNDIDAWIEFALSHGAKSIILEGHSFGIGKVTYYMAHGKYREKVRAVIFLGTHGVYQTQQLYLEKKNVPPSLYLEEAQNLLAKGQPATLLEDPHALAGYYPASAQTYKNFFTPGSALFKSTQMAVAQEGGYRHLITTPLLWVLGDMPEKEYLFTPFEEAFRLVRAENPQIEIRQLNNCNHGFHGKERELAEAINNFLARE